MRLFLSNNLENVLSDMYLMALQSDVPEGLEWDYTRSVILGKQGMKPPWPREPQQVADWQIEQTVRLLKEAELFVVSPAAHAAVMAAAATLEPADTATLDREADVMAQSGLLVLPEPLVLVNRNGSLSDVAAWGWQFSDHYVKFPPEQYPGVRVTTFMDRDGPVQTSDWQLFVAQARAAGSPVPRLFPDGMYGMRGDHALAEETAETLTTLSQEYRRIQSALKEAGSWRAEPAPEVGEWGGGQVDDTYDDFTQRYMFAFWRLAAQGITTASTPTGRPPTAGTHGKTEPVDNVRVIRLTAQASGRQAQSAQSAGNRAYHHRWPVRMHKVRQWYPSRQEHRVIWRGPYIKGPADAPLLIGEKAYLVD
ncbi:hypothetical protein ABZZ36_28575 [Actinacidiphila glaucinigra]|uniref:hypothetical protein n=1 Tax=Actinacidiphila glaucinigra TaxID=235986 RepID=UPI00339F9A23